jgi:hypothetical protein
MNLIINGNFLRICNFDHFQASSLKEASRLKHFIEFLKWYLYMEKQHMGHLPREI